MGQNTSESQLLHLPAPPEARCHHNTPNWLTAAGLGIGNARRRPKETPPWSGTVEIHYMTILRKGRAEVGILRVVLWGALESFIPVWGICW